MSSWFARLYIHITVIESNLSWESIMAQIYIHNTVIESNLGVHYGVIMFQNILDRDPAMILLWKHDD